MTPTICLLPLLLGLGPGDQGVPGLFPPFGDPPAEQTADFFDSRDRVRVELMPDATSVVPGSDHVLAVIFDQDHGWHIYAGDQEIPPEYFPTVLVAETPAGAPLTVHEDWVQWPEYDEVDFFGDILPVYEGTAIVYLPVTIAPNAPPGRYTVRIKAGFQVCDDMTCLQPTPYPPRTPEGEPSEEWTAYGQDVTIEVVATPAASTPDPATFGGFDTSVFARIHQGEKPPLEVDFDLFGLGFSINAAGAGGFLLLLVAAAFGGFLLNLTPCVLPIIPIKIMGLSASAGNRRRMLFLGTAMSIGVVAFWVALGICIAALAGFTATNQLFQYPLFTIGVGVIIALMAVGMCGLFAVRLPNFVYTINPGHDSAAGSVGFGVMTAVLSTPCTAPFMGAAAAAAAVMAPTRTLLVFAAIGLGMALPYQILSMAPKLVDRMPRTGPASELIKQVMGLLMLAAAAFFVGTGVSGLLVNPPAPPTLLHWWVVAAFGVAAGGWLAWRTFRITRRGGMRLIFGTLGVAILAISAFIGVRLTDGGPINWTYYTPAEFATAQSEGKVVLMDFTAEWCLNCKALEKTVLYDDRVVKLVATDTVRPIKVDLTGNNPDGNAMLKAVERLTIPLLVVFDANGREVFKGDFYTVEQVVTALNEAHEAPLAQRAP